MVGAPRKPWKEPAFAGLLTQDGELHGIWAAGETLQINFGAGAFRFDDAIDEEAGHARGGQVRRKRASAKIAVRSLVYQRVG